MGSRGWVRRHAGDLFVVALAVGTVGELALSDVPGSQPLLAAFALGWTLPLLARRRLPLVAPLSVMAVLVVGSFAVGEGEASLATPVLAVFLSAWSVGRRNATPRALVGLAAGYACTQVLTTRFGAGSVSPGDVLFAFVIYAAPWIAGAAVRARVSRSAELAARMRSIELEREATALVAVADERARIARELHDVVAHSISVMTIQAGAARMLLDDDPARADEPLARVEDTGRETLAELRRVLGVLRLDTATDPLEPRPSLARIDGLLARYRSSGLTVELETTGAPRPLPPGIDQAAYRVVQEALTNTLKHGRARRVSVRLSFLRDAIALEVADDGRATPVAPTRRGHGLLGMRERVDLYGGTLETGPREGGAGFVVRARFPVESYA